MPRNTKSIAAKQRENRKKGIIDPKEAADEVADPTWVALGAGFPCLDNKAVSMGVFALNAADLRGFSPQPQDQFFYAFSTQEPSRILQPAHVEPSSDAPEVPLLFLHAD